MFSDVWFWVVSVGLALVAVAFYYVPRIRMARARRAEGDRRRVEEQQEREKAAAARRARQWDAFREQRLVVFIREKDGRKSGFEAVLIRTLLHTGITVEPWSETSGRAVAGGDTALLGDGRLALVGTSWESGKVGNEYDDDYDPPRMYCDYRLLAAIGGSEKIIGAGCAHERSSGDSPGEALLASAIIEDLVATFPVAARAE